MKQSKLTKRVAFLLTILLAVFFTLFSNGIALILSNRYNLSLDLTKSAAYRLSGDSLALVQGLTEEVSIFVLAPRDSFDGNPYLVQARNILDQYERQSDRIHLSYIDYARDPAFASKYPDLSLAPGNLLVISGDNKRQLALSELFNYAQSASSAGGSAVVSSRAEEAVSSAILQVTQGKAKKVAFLTGADTESLPALLSLLKDNNYQASQVNLASEDITGYDICWLAAPKVDLSLTSLNKLDAFLYDGGRYQKTLVYTMDAGQPNLPNLAAYLKEWGAVVLQGAVFETNASRTFQMQPFYPLTQYAQEEFSAKLRDAQIPLLLPRSLPFQLQFETRDFQRTSTLLRFSESSGVRPAQAGSDFNPQNAAIKGPLPALALLTRQGKGLEGAALRSHILLSASTAMLEAQALQNTQLANAEYLLKLLGGLSGDEQVLALQPVSLAAARLSVPSGSLQLLGILLMWVVPGVLLLFGIAVFLYRRHQ